MPENISEGIGVLPKITVNKIATNSPSQYPQMDMRHHQQNHQWTRRITEDPEFHLRKASQYHKHHDHRSPNSARDEKRH